MNTSSLTVSNVRKHSMHRENPDASTIVLQSAYELAPYLDNTGVWLHHWAEQTPDAIFLAEREEKGDGWRELSYAESLQQVRGVAAALLQQGLQPGQAIVVLSGNGVDHGLLALAAQYIGCAIVPLAEQYSLIPDAHGRLRYIVDKVKPAMAFVSDAERFSNALALDCLQDVRVIASHTGSNGDAVAFSELAATSPDESLDLAYRNVGPDNVAKILFTSGSTSHPKGVITTQRMMCVNQIQLAQSLPFLQDRPPKILDWLPWNHVFGGSHNFNMMLANGGSLYIDDGRPLAGAFQRTIENLHQHAGTLAFNVPLGFSLLVDAMSGDDALKAKFFQDLDLLFYAGASLPQSVWQQLENFAMEVRGKLPLMISSWGMTETAPATLIVHEPCRRSGVIGVPVPGAFIKLLDNGDGRYEMRVKGPNVMPSYFEDPEKTAESFDSEGYLITGDAVRFADPDNESLGLAFDGRISEDFKLQSGTWVQASNLRVNVLKAMADIAQDIVICGQDRVEIGILIFPQATATAAASVDNGAWTGQELSDIIQQRLQALAETSTGSSSRIIRALVLSDPPSLQHHEITVKGNLNIRRVLDHRAALVNRLYDDNDPATIMLKRS